LGSKLLKITPIGNSDLFEPLSQKTRLITYLAVFQTIIAGNKLVFDFNIFQENGEYYCGLSEPNKPTEFKVKMQNSGNNFVIDFPVAIPIEGEDFYFRFSISKIESKKMSGSTIVSNKKGIEISKPFEAIRLE